MAHLLPSDISHLALAGAREPELETLRQLQAKLPPAYTVFHGVHWSREYKSDIKFGELDFVVVNQGGKALVIEQKNGPLEETANGLVKVYPERAKSVGDQVRRALDGVREKFKWVHRNQADLDLDYLIYCPDYRIANLNAASIDASRVVDAPRAAIVPASGKRLSVDGVEVRGVVEIRTTEFGKLRAVNWLGLEHYLRGVVPRELGPEIWPELEALNPPVPANIEVSDERRIPAEKKAAAYSDHNWAGPKTSWGHPSLQGTWSTDDMRGIPFDRPQELGTHDTYRPGPGKQQHDDEERPEARDNDTGNYHQDIEKGHAAPDFQKALEEKVGPTAKITLQAAGNDADDRADRRQCKAKGNGDAEAIDKPRHDIPCLVIGAKPIRG